MIDHNKVDLIKDNIGELIESLADITWTLEKAHKQIKELEEQFGVKIEDLIEVVEEIKKGAGAP